MLDIPTNSFKKTTVVNETYDLLKNTEYMQQINNEYYLHRPSSSAPIREMRIRSFKPIEFKYIEKIPLYTATIRIQPIIGTIISTIGGNKIESTYAPEKGLWNSLGEIDLPISKQTFSIYFSNSIEQHINDVNDVLSNYFNDFDWDGTFVFNIPGASTTEKNRLIGRVQGYTHVSKYSVTENVLSWFTINNQIYQNVFEDNEYRVYAIFDEFDIDLTRLPGLVLNKPVTFATQNTSLELNQTYVYDGESIYNIVYDGKLNFEAKLVKENIINAKFMCNSSNNIYYIIDNNLYEYDLIENTIDIISKKVSYVTYFNDSLFIVHVNNSIYYSNDDNLNYITDNLQNITAPITKILLKNANTYLITDLDGKIYEYDLDFNLKTIPDLGYAIEDLYIIGEQLLNVKVDEVDILKSDYTITKTEVFVSKQVLITNNLSMVCNEKQYGLIGKHGEKDFVTINKYFDSNIILNRSVDLSPNRLFTKLNHNFTTDNMLFTLGVKNSDNTFTERYVLMFYVEVNTRPSNLYSISSKTQIFNTFNKYSEGVVYIMNNQCISLPANYLTNIEIAEYKINGLYLTLSSNYMNNLSQRIYVGTTEAQVVYKKMNILPSSNYFPVKITNQNNETVDLDTLKTFFSQIIVEIDYIFDEV